MQSLALNSTAEFEQFRHDVYTPIEEAVKLLDARQAVELWTDLDRDALLDIPPVLRRPRSAILFRQIGTPNHELHHVIAMTERLGLNLVIWEYHADRFLARNPCKHALGRLAFYAGVGRNGGRKMRYVNVIDFNRYDGVPLGEVRTLWGQPLIDFHHELLLREFPRLAPESLFDASAWFKTHGGAARQYYKAFTMLFVRHAILLETFMLEGEELQFTRDIFLPALRDAQASFGVKPLVAYSEPPDREGDDHWLAYPAHLQQTLPRELQVQPKPRPPHRDQPSTATLTPALTCC